jgi:glycosyltransferase involved in cell wall biosynthesis
MLKDEAGAPKKICVIIPCYKVKKQLKKVVESCPSYIDKIFVIDDCCPEGSGAYILQVSNDERIEVIIHATNLGVGGAMRTGYVAAMSQHFDIAVKIDGDGQMDSNQIENLIHPILAMKADYTKGNRFFEIEAVRQMPKIRVIGNLGLTFMTKFSTGLWHIFDPNNGFTAIRGSILKKINLDKIDNRYFFESDMLFRLGLINARVRDVPIPPIYGEEKSNLKIKRVLFEFPLKHGRNYLKRIMYTYYLRDFNLASVQLPVGIALSGFGTILGIYSWINGIVAERPTPTGTLILIAMSFLAGLQLVLAFLSYDSNNSNA